MASNVTDQILAQQRVQDFNEEPTASNEELLPQLTMAGARLDMAVADCEPRVFSQKKSA